ncbi:MAG TPA: hypothetical protein VF322_14670 [Gammaproteobacteria bacterium]
MPRRDDDEARRKAKRGAVLLALLALGVYVGYFLLNLLTRA